MRKTIIILISILMFTSMMVVPGNTGDVEAGVPDTTTLALTPHAPIRINSNADFPGIATAGDGSIGDPWIIENWEINGTGNGTCIFVGNVTEHFEIRDCDLSNSDGSSIWPHVGNYGLILNNTYGGNITNCSFNFNEAGGIHITDSQYLNLSYNIFHDCPIGIEMVSSSNLMIKHNDIQNCTSTGINSRNYSNNNIIENNTFMNNDNRAIVIKGSFNLINNNSFFGNYRDIDILYGDNNHISNNSFNNCTDISIITILSWFNQIYNNTFTYNNIDISIEWDGGGQKIYHNMFIDSALPPYDSGSTDSEWDNGYPSGGNYWSNHTGYDNYSGPDQDIPGSDGIIDTNYTGFSGLFNAVDNYPFKKPFDYVDSLAPNSSVVSIIPYLQTDPVDITATAVDDDAGIANVTLFYRYSSDNVTFGNWTFFGLDAVYPYEWNFDFPAGEGFYQFYSIAIDNLNNTEDEPVTADAHCVYDINPPISSVDDPAPYWHNTPINISINASDAGIGVANVTLFYNYSPDNATSVFGTEFGTDLAAPWNFTFDFPAGEGYYEFFSIATDIFNNTESLPLSGYASCGYDATTPQSEVLQPDFWQDNHTVYLEWETNETLSGFGPLSLGQYPSHDNVDLCMRYSLDNQTWGIWKLVTENMVNSSTHNITVLEDGYYQFYTIAQDIAGNLEAPPMDSDSSVTYDIYIGIDTVSPVAVAADEQNYTISQFSTVMFDASASTDNMGIHSYTWNFTHIVNGTLQEVVIHDPAFNFTFGYYGQYPITLTVIDQAGNMDQDIMNFNITDDEAPIANAGPDQHKDQLAWVTFRGIDSSDNVGIVDYTWTFSYNGTIITLEGAQPKFRFMYHGNYNVTMTVTDLAGNTASDNVMIYIAEDISSTGSGYNWIIVIFVLVLLLCVIMIMAFYFKKTSSVGSEERDDEYDEYGEDDRYDGRR